MQSRLDALNDADNVEALRRAEEAAAAKYKDLAGQLGRLRKQAGKDLARSVNSALSELALADARFEVRLQALDDPRAAGMEEVGFFVSTHSGLPAGPLEKIASGGELSRISLAIQTAMSGQAGVPTLILDEVDVGIGGAVAEAVGRRLAQLGKSKQVLVITHLPQVASWGDQHLLVSKSVVDEKLQSDIRPLDNRARVEEIARMLGGQEITRPRAGMRRRCWNSPWSGEGTSSKEVPRLRGSARLRTPSALAARAHETRMQVAEGAGSDGRLLVRPIGAVFLRAIGVNLQ